MKDKLNKILVAIQAIAALCMIGAIKIWAPVCGEMLQLINGKEVHMKCFYAGQAAIGISMIILVASIIALISKKNNKGLMIVNAESALILFVTFGKLIGICANDAMRCHTTAMWGRIMAVIIIVISLVMLVTDKEGQIPN